MVKLCNIAVIGAGVSGLAAASLLKQQGQNVTVFEKYSEPSPVGAGLVLQQTGLAVLANLNLDKAAVEQGAKINRFLGKSANDETVYDLHHERLSPNYFSLGIHRHSISKLLHDKATSLDIPFIYSFNSSDVAVENDKYVLISSDNQRFANFDLIVDASGTHSLIRDKFAKLRFRKPFAYGALWGVCEDSGDLPLNVLQQRFHKAKTGVGLIPIGKRPGHGNKNYFAFHWSMRHTDYKAWRNTPLERWKTEVVRLYGDARNFVAQFNEHDDLTLADYREIALEKFYSDRIVFIGDACHSISPRLGQGANLGLVDALILSRQLAMSTDIETALSSYETERKEHVRFYHRASRLMNFLFQSDNVAASMMRDTSFKIMCAIPYTHREMLTTMGGLKTGLFSSSDPGSLHPDYTLLR